MTTTQRAATKQEQIAEERRTLTYRESLAQSWSSPSAEKAEHAILSFTPFFPESDGRRRAQSRRVDIGDGLHLNEFEVVNTEAEACRDTDMVVLHGYGAGLGLFFQNFDAWSSIPGSRVFALDLLGFGRSARPKFTVPTKDVGQRDDEGRFPAVLETEAWFVDSIERWRARKGLDSFVLMGHSLGGYLAAAYALQHPERVRKLIMVSPAGVERGYKPELEEKTLYKRSEVAGPAVESELTETQAEQREHHADSLVNELATSNRQLPSYIQYLWNSHISPFSILRSSGFFAPKLVSRWTHRRFGDLAPSARDAMHTYAYRIFTAKPSGEYALTRILAPGAVARMPMISRIPGALKCPSTWIYGENDWMNVHAGKETVARLKRDGLRADFHVVPNAGHHVYLDNPKSFDSIIHDFLKN
jgi:cardiolipin-specific phospholipase